MHVQCLSYDLEASWQPGQADELRLCICERVKPTSGVESTSNLSGAFQNMCSLEGGVTSSIK